MKNLFSVTIAILAIAFFSSEEKEGSLLLINNASIDSYTSKKPKTGTFRDKRDKKVYKWVQIGKQRWMAENLNVAVFSNGDSIPYIDTPQEWVKTGREGKPAYTYYNFDPINGEKFGKLYNYFAVTDPRGLAPRGWRVPSDADWTLLTDYLGGGETVAGKKMKHTDLWLDYEGKSGNGTNESGFSALPAGRIIDDGRFYGLGRIAYFWSTDPFNNFVAWHRELANRYEYVTRIYFPKRDGISVRCVKN